MRLCRMKGLNGKPIAIDMDAVEMVEMVDECETHLHTSSDWYRASETFEAVMAMWEHSN